MGQDKWARPRSLGELQNKSYDHTYRIFKVVPYGYTGSAYSALPAAPTTLTIYNVTVTNADQEYSQALPAGTKKFKIYAVDSNKRYPHADTLKYTTTSGGSGTTFIPIPPMGYDLVENVNLTGVTLYFQSKTGSAVVIIECWA